MSVPQLAVITPYYPPVLGGAENQMALIAEGLAAEGVGTVVYTSAAPIERRLSAENRMRIAVCAPARGSGAAWRSDLLQRLQTVTTPYSAALDVRVNCQLAVVEIYEPAQFHRSGTSSNRGEHSSLSV